MLQKALENTAEAIGLSLKIAFKHFSFKMAILAMFWAMNKCNALLAI